MKYAIGQHLKIGDYSMVVSSVTETHVIGPHIGGVGIVHVPLDEVTKVLPAAKNAAQLIAAAAEPVVIKTPKVAKTAPVIKAPKRKATGGKTKFELAQDLARANKDLTRQEFIQLLVKELGMTPAGASTYASTARKGI